MTTIRTRGILTSCLNEEQSILDLDYEIKPYDDKRKSIWLIGGVTGWESFVIDTDLKNLKSMAEHGWLANAGTKNRYDRLFIPADEMKLVSSLIDEMERNKEGQ